jgi:hypothetical protein
MIPIAIKVNTSIISDTIPIAESLLRNKIGSSIRRIIIEYKCALPQSAALNVLHMS